LMATWEVFTPGVCGAVLMRSDFIDRCLQAAIEAGIEQLVILGAGFDTRALRLKALGNLGRIFEIDHPATQSVKIDKLRRLSTGIPSHVTYIGIDFETEHLSEKLLKNGYTPKTRSFFIWEGVTYYIPAAAVEATLAFIVNQSAAGSGLVFDYFSPEVVNGTCRRTEAVRLKAGLKRFGESMERFRKGKGIMFGLVVCMAITIVDGSVIRPPVAGAKVPITLTFATENEFAGFDAIQVRGFAICDAIANHAIQERLFDADDNGNLVPVLGLSATASADQTVWTVKLRQGVFFHDKTPFNADAVVAHWQRLLDPANRFRGRSTFAPLLSVEKDDAYTVRFNLKHPWLPFPRVLTETRMLGTYIPSPTAVDAGTQLRAPVGTGPFMFKKWTAGDHFEVVRNPNYWGTIQGNLDTIVFKFVPDEQTRYASLKSGQMQMIWMDRGTIIRQADTDPSVRHYQCDGDGAEIFVLNTTRPPLDDKRVRQALAMAWNQTACVKMSYHDAIPEAVTPFGRAIDCGGAGYPVHNLEKARALIVQYG
jgi:methyltransferase (TIGR00027 family)